MEIYNGQPTAIIIDVPTGSTGPVNIVVKRDGQTVLGPVNATLTDNTVTVNIPYLVTVLDGDLTIDVSFTLGTDSITKTVPSRIVTPLLTMREMHSLLPTASDDEVTRVERKVRSVIEAFTGQYFGKYTGTVSVYGGGDSFLYSNRRIMSVTGIEYNGSTFPGSGFQITRDGWAVTPAKGYLEVNTISSGDVYRSGPVISSPYGNATFTTGIAYGITGVFGYDYVPFDVKEAARALVNDYACQESLYRERYISDIRAADWRFAFNSGAFIGTGNVVADQLLAGYQKNILAVI